MSPPPWSNSWLCLHLHLCWFQGESVLMHWKSFANKWHKLFCSFLCLIFLFLFPGLNFILLVHFIGKPGHGAPNTVDAMVQFLGGSTIAIQCNAMFGHFCICPLAWTRQVHDTKGYKLRWFSHGCQIEEFAWWEGRLSSLFLVPVHELPPVFQCHVEQSLVDFIIIIQCFASYLEKLKWVSSVHLHEQESLSTKGARNLSVSSGCVHLCCHWQWQCKSASKLGAFFIALKVGVTEEKPWTDDMLTWTSNAMMAAIS